MLIARDCHANLRFARNDRLFVRGFKLWFCIFRSTFFAFLSYLPPLEQGNGQ